MTDLRQLSLCSCHNFSRSSRSTISRSASIAGGNTGPKKGLQKAPNESLAHNKHSPAEAMMAFMRSSAFCTGYCRVHSVQKAFASLRTCASQSLDESPIVQLTLIPVRGRPCLSIIPSGIGRWMAMKKRRVVAGEKVSRKTEAAFGSSSSFEPVPR